MVEVAQGIEFFESQPPPTIIILPCPQSSTIQCTQSIAIPYPNNTIQLFMGRSSSYVHLTQLRRVKHLLYLSYMFIDAFLEYESFYEPTVHIKAENDPVVDGRGVVTVAIHCKPPLVTSQFASLRPSARHSVNSWNPPNPSRKRTSPDSPPTLHLWVFQWCPRCSTAPSSSCPPGRAIGSPRPGRSRSRLWSDDSPGGTTGCDRGKWIPFLATVPSQGPGNQGTTHRER